MNLLEKWLKTLAGESFSVGTLEMGLLHDDGDGLAEITASGYDRADVTDAFSINDGKLVNDATIYFDEVTENTNQIVAIGMYFDGEEQPFRSIRLSGVSMEPGDVFTIKPGSIKTFFGPQIELEQRLEFGHGNRDALALFNPSVDWIIEDMGPPKHRANLDNSDRNFPNN